MYSCLLIFIINRVLYLNIHPAAQNMIGSQVQQQKVTFLGRKNGFQVLVSLQKHDSQPNLLIELRNQHKMQYFELKVNREQINENPDMKFLFQTPEDLYHTIIQLFQEISITEEGVILFQMKLNASKIKKKVFRLKANRKDVESIDILRMKFQNLQKQVNVEMVRKNLKIQNLTNKNVQCMNMLLILKEEVSEMRKEQGQLILQNKKKQFQMNAVLKQNQLQRQELAILRRSLDEFNRKFSLMEFYNFFDNPHWHHFSVYKGTNSLRVLKKTNDNVWNSFIRNTVLLEGKIYEVTIKQLKTCYRNIMMGIATRQCFGLESAYKSKACISYNSYSGNIWQNGSSKKGGNAISDGETVILQINLINYRVCWRTLTNKIGEAQISQSFRSRQLYLLIQMYNMDDQIQIMLY